MSASWQIDSPINIGVSACLLGHAVRFDGGHKRNRYLLCVLDRFFNWVPVCPEIELGLGTPRASMRLQRRNGRVRLVVPRQNVDLSRKMRDFCRLRVNELADSRLCGYILKKNSPSCGMQRVRVYDDHSQPQRNGQGLFAQALTARFANLPVEEEGRLENPVLRENWITRVFAYHRLQMLRQSGLDGSDLHRFHREHKYLLMAHSPEKCGQLGRLASGLKHLDRRQLQDAYERLFMNALSEIATAGKNTNVLMHMCGMLKKHLDLTARRELRELVLDYHNGLLPLSAPLTLISHHAHTLGVKRLQDQVYLNPHPKQLALRNHVEKPHHPTIRRYGAAAVKEQSPEACYFNQHYPCK